MLPACAQTQDPPAALVGCSLTINGQRHDLQLDTRVTLLDYFVRICR